MIQDSQAIPSNFLAADSDIKKLFHLFSKAPVGLAIFTGPLFILEFVNDNTLKVWGKKREEVLGKPLFEIFPELTHHGLFEIMNRVYTKAERFRAKEYEVNFLKDGEPVTGYFDFTLEPITGADETISSIIAVTSEITEEVLNRKKLKESENRFISLAREAPLFVWVTRENLQTTYINKTGLDYFGLDESIDLSGLSWKRFIHPDDIERVLETMFNAAKKRLSYTLEMRLKNGVTGKYRWFLDKGVPQYNHETFTGFIGTSLDIEDRKEAERKMEEKVRERTIELVTQNELLKKQNDLIRKILDSTLDLITVYDVHTRIVTINQSALNTFGYKEEDVIGKKLTEAFPQLTNTKGYLDLLSALNGETIHNEIYQSSITGKYHENFMIPLYGDDNKIYGVLAIAHDNTSLINKNKELNEVQQIAQLGSWDWNPGTNEVTWSEQMYHIYGYGNEKFPVSFEKAVERMMPEDGIRVRQRMNEYLVEARQLFDEKGLTIFNNPAIEYSIFLPDGSNKVLRGAGKIILDPHGNILKVIGTVLDITEQKRSEKQLIEVNEKLEQRNQFVEKLINSSLDIIMVIDTQLRFITFNKKAESVITSYYPGELIGKTILEADPSIKNSEAYQDIQSAFKGEIIIRDKVKSSISENYYEHNYVPLLNAAGNVYAVMIISHDITENIKQMEELKKLSESDQLKNDFIKMASHELKTPITSIKGYVQLLLTALQEKKETNSLSPLLVRSSLISIDKQTARLTRLMSELLDLSKIEAGMLELTKEIFSLNELVIETVQDILYTHSKHSIHIFHDFGSNVFGDKDRIGQVLINFLTNAIKYSPGSEKIEVWVKKSGDQSVAVSVKDYGIGIEKKDHKKIFERFYRAQGKEEQTFPGFGIGLFIVKEIIERHNGTLHLESEKGKGSVFTFILPIAHEQKHTNEEKRKDPGSG